MEDAPIQIGILGAGNWTRTVHLPNLRSIPGARVVAVSSNHLERRQQARDAWGGALCFYEEPEDLVEDPGVEAVIVCTPNDTHQALAVAALRAGKHVLCEKPVAFTPEGVDEIAAACPAGAVFQADLELRYSDVVLRMAELIRGGEIGEPRMVSCFLMRNWGSFRGWRGDPAVSGGMFLELGIHYLDLFNALAGGRPERVFATGGHSLGAAQPDYLWCTVEYDNGARASLGLTVLAPARNEIRLHVIGSEARLEAEIISGSVSLWPRTHPEPENRSPERPPDYGFHGFPGSLEALEHWLHCIRTGEAPLAGLEVARAATAVSAAAEASLKSGEPVRLT